jgi:hypothetical protein
MPTAREIALELLPHLAENLLTKSLLSYVLKLLQVIARYRFSGSAFVYKVAFV